jgi:hypothetical protein
MWAFMTTTERRTSLRTKTRLPMTLRRGELILEGHCVELSQSGMLVEVAGMPDGIWPYASVTLELPGGAIPVVTRRVARRGKRLALAIALIEEADEERLTEFLFDRMLLEAGRARLRRRRPRLRLRAVA